jgi:hypothetical protein
MAALSIARWGLHIVLGAARGFDDQCRKLFSGKTDTIVSNSARMSAFCLAWVISCAAPHGLAQTAADILISQSWEEARSLTKTWRTEGATLQVAEADDVYVTPGLSVVVGKKFVASLNERPDGKQALLFAMLHELWHVHQISSDRAAYTNPAQRPVLECAADARAAFAMTRAYNAVLRSDSPAALGEQVALRLDIIPGIAASFRNLNEVSAFSLQHLSSQKRRFAAQIGVLQALSSESARMPSTYSAGVYGRLQRQSTAFWMMFPMQGMSDQDKLDETCSHIAGSDTGKDVRVSFEKSETSMRNGQRVYAAVHKVQNLRNEPIRYSFLSIDGVVPNESKDDDFTLMTGMRRTSVDVTARGVAEFQAFSVLPPLDPSRQKYLPFYIGGKLDKVTVLGLVVPPPACFDDIPATATTILDKTTKLAIRVGQSAMRKFESVRGEEEKFLTSDMVKVFKYSFDVGANSSGLIHYSYIEGFSYASLDLYRGDDKAAALAVIDRIHQYAKEYCPASDDPAFPLYSRDDADSTLDFRSFTTGSSASVVLFLPEADDPPESEISVSWIIRTNHIGN